MTQPYKADATALEIRILNDIINRLTKRDIEKRLAVSKAGISSLQYFMLRMLCRHEYTISELGRKFTHDPATLVQAIDTLERQNLVQRGQDPKDRRRNPLLLTGEGKALLDRIPPMGEDDSLIQGLAVLGPEKSVQLLSLLRELASSMVEDPQVVHNLRETVEGVLSTHAHLGKADISPSDNKI